MSDPVETNSSEEYHRQARRTGPGGTPQSPWRKGVDGPSVRDGGELSPAGSHALRPEASCWDIWLRLSQRVHSAACCPSLRPTWSSAAPSRPHPHAGFLFEHKAAKRKKKKNEQTKSRPEKSHLVWAVRLSGFHSSFALAVRELDSLFSSAWSTAPNTERRLLVFIIIDNQPQQMEEPWNPLDSPN